MSDDDQLPEVDRRKMQVDRPEIAKVMPADVGGKEYDFVYEPRCRVCTSGDSILMNVNRALAEGYTYMDVLRLVEPFNRNLEKKITYTSIRNHQKRHMPFEASAMREILEERANRAEKDFVEGKTRIVTAAGYAEVMMHKAFDRLINDQEPVTIEQGLKAAQVLESLTANDESQNLAEEMFSKLGRIIDAVKKVSTPDQIRQIMAELESTTPPELEAEIVDE